MIAAGALRQRFTVLTPKTGKDAYGQRQSGYDRGPTLWGEIRAIRGDETNYADGAAQRTIWSIKCRWISGVEAGIDAKSVLEYRDIKIQVDSVLREREEEDAMLIDGVEIQ
jgi:head-tail adaptor